MTFRIADLQTLLTGCGRSRSGRKHELLGRALSLLKSTDGVREEVKKHILEIYHRRYPQRHAQPSAMYHDYSPSQFNSMKDDSYRSSYKHSSSSSHR